MRSTREIFFYSTDLSTSFRRHGICQEVIHYNNLSPISLIKGEPLVTASWRVFEFADIGEICQVLWVTANIQYKHSRTDDNCGRPLGFWGSCSPKALLRRNSLY